MRWAVNWKMVWWLLRQHRVVVVVCDAIGFFAFRWHPRCAIADASEEKTEPKTRSAAGPNLNQTYS
jgi:hypothetical protein